LKKRIILTSALPGERYKKLLNESGVEVKVLSPEERKDLRNAVSSFDPEGLITLLSDKIDK
jgi:hypothetical protein